MLRGVYPGVTLWGYPNVPGNWCVHLPVQERGTVLPGWPCLHKGRGCSAGEPRHWEPQRGEDAPEEDEGLCDPES